MTARPRTSMTTAVRMELRKLRRKHYWLMAGGITIVLSLWNLVIQLQRTGTSGADNQMLGVLALNEGLQMLAMFLPGIIAVLASRMVTVDTEERMDQMMSSLGQCETTRFVAKLIVLSTVATVISLAMMASGLAAPGLRATPALWSTLPLLPVLVVSTAVAVSAVQLALSACLAKQAVTIAVAAIGGLVISMCSIALKMPQIGWLTPWGLVGSACPIDYAATQEAVAAGGTDAVLVSSPWLVVATALVLAVIWTAASCTAVARKEINR